MESNRAQPPEVKVKPYSPYPLAATTVALISSVTSVWAVASPSRSDSVEKRQIIRTKKTQLLD